MSSAAAETPVPAPTQYPATVNELPEETLDFAARMFDLARNGATEDLSAYIDAGLPSNLTNHAGDTLLMLAAYHGHAETVSALVMRGADPNTLNAKGQSPLAGAVFKGEEEVVKVLVRSGADANTGTPSAMQAATLFNKPHYVAMFNSAGSQTTAATKSVT
ncbi:ankyrin [Exidia glandulosa HHB12029]|uniref:Ankyrin n=1 Tax=Exidia glandulosa HHB12029 TaxID=1314781 RepID=A0A165L191_EXIGL|nr:ankyrin [Exidia glandulosa HHB12029]